MAKELIPLCCTEFQGKGFLTLWSVDMKPETKLAGGHLRFVLMVISIITGAYRIVGQCSEVSQSSCAGRPSGNVSGILIPFLWKGSGTRSQHIRITQIQVLPGAALGRP